MNKLNTILKNTDNTDKNINILTDNTDILYKERQSGGIKFQYDCDKLYEQYKHLCGDSRFRAFYIRKFYELGTKRSLELIAVAQKDDINLGWLLKNQV